MTNTKGTTLVELLVAMTLFTVVLGGIFSLHWMAQQNFVNIDSVSEAQKEFRKIKNHIINDLSSCNSFDVKESLQGESLQEGNFLLIETESGLICYYIDEDKLIKSENDKTTTISENINSLLFSNPSPNFLRIKITFNYGKDACTYETGYLKTI